MKQDGYEIISELSSKLLKRASDKAIERSMKAGRVFKNAKDPIARAKNLKPGQIAKASRANKYAKKKFDQGVRLHSKSLG